MSPTLSMADTIREKLEAAFRPTHLEVVDESHLHAGHAGARDHAARFGSQESHFRVAITSARFAELPRVARHKAVMDALSEEMPRIHALSIDARVADDAPSGSALPDSDPETGKSRGWVTKDTTKSAGLFD